MNITGVDIFFMIVIPLAWVGLGTFIAAWDFNKQTWRADLKRDWNRYFGEKQKPDPRPKDKLNGKGIITFDDGTKWEGEFKDGEFKGIKTTPEAEKHEGKIKGSNLRRKGKRNSTGQP